jgi:hypothetical protein
VRQGRAWRVDISGIEEADGRSAGSPAGGKACFEARTGDRGCSRLVGVEVSSDEPEIASTNKWLGNPKPTEALDIHA